MSASSVLLPAGNTPKNVNASNAGQWFEGLGLNIRGGNEDAILRRMLIAALMPQLAQSIDMGSQIQQQIPGLLSSIMPGSRQGQVQKASNLAFSHAARAAKQSAAMGQSQGLGSGMVGGMNDAIFNNAAVQSNEAARYFNSPEYAGQTLGVLQGAMQPANAPLVGSLIGSQPFVKPQESGGILGGLLGGFGGALGAAAGNAVGKIKF